MTEPDDALLWARKWWAARCERLGLASLSQVYLRGDRDAHIADEADAYRAGAAASADRIKALEAENAALQDLAGRLRVEMSDMLTRLKEEYPDEFVGLEDGDEPTDEDAYGWGCQEWGDPR